MIEGLVLGQWVACCDAAERAGDQITEAVKGDNVARDYTARQLGRAARAALLAIYHLECGLSNDEARSIATALVKLTGGAWAVKPPPEATGERRGR